MIVISAPKGTSLEMGEEEQGESILKMDSAGKGKIRVYNCNAERGVEELDLAKTADWVILLAYISQFPPAIYK